MEEKKVELPIEFTINILKVPESEKHCIEGFIIKGDQFHFSNIFKTMKEYFGGHANVAEDD